MDLSKKSNKQEKLKSKITDYNNKNSEYLKKSKMKKKIKNSKIFTNIKEVDEDGLIKLKTGEVASLLEVQAIDLSLASKSEKENFFYLLKSFYQIKGLNIKCYKLDQKINLNDNKIYLDNLIEYFKDDKKKMKLLDESRRLIEELEKENYTISSILDNDSYKRKLT